MEIINRDDFLKKYEEGGVQVIDVRGTDEYASGHMRGALNIPLDQIEQGKTEKIELSKPVYLICLSGNRSRIAAEKLSMRGGQQVYSVQGGVKSCQDHPAYIKITKAVLPLMRQVQIAAGSLVLIGILLSQFVNPAFVWLSAFVGAGLVFAGISGFCGMMRLLAYLPWNKNSIRCQE